MKRVTLGIAMASVLALSAYSLAGAQERQRGAGSGPWGDAPGAGRGAMMMLRGVDLSEPQRSEVRAILQSHRGTLDTVRAEARLHRELRAELLADAPDGQKLAEIQQQIVQAHGERLAAQVAIGQQLSQVLTAEQRATVRERLAEAPGRGFGQRGGPDSRRPRQN